MSTSASAHAELSSLATIVDDVARRVTTIAERTTGTADDWLATELFHVERSLGDAQRRLTKLSRRTKPA